MIFLFVVFGSCNPSDGTKSISKTSTTDIEESFTIKGTIANLRNGWVKLYEETSDYSIFPMDSTVLKDGHFSLVGSLERMKPVFLTINDTLVTPLVFLEKGETVSIDAFLKMEPLSKEYYLDCKIKGTEINETYQNYSNQVDSAIAESTRTRLDSLSNIIHNLNANTDSITLNGFYKEAQTLIGYMNQKIDSVRKAFIFAHGSSPIAPYLLVNEGSGFNQDTFSVIEMGQLFGNLDSSLFEDSFYKLCHQKLNKAKSLAVGEPAPNFQYENEDGSKSSLSDLKGNYVLLEFWAYWCAPCLDRFPDLATTYKTYANSGFEVLAIHDNTDTSVWLQTHETMDLPWQPIHVVKTHNGKTSLWETYDIETLPTTYLIDKEGKITVRNPSNEMLKDILANDGLEKEISSIRLR